MQYNDTLGFYYNGTKRTLTDEQIAIFRHSELQAILRKQRHARETKRSEFVAVARSKEMEEGLWGLQEMDYSYNNKEKRNMFEEEYDHDQDDEEEYALFLAAERREMELAVSEDKMNESKKTKQRGGNVSTRRTVRELDAAVGNANVLDYGEDPQTASTTDNNHTLNDIDTTCKSQVDNKVNQPVSEGRQIWWPEIGE